ncbi:MAG: homoserine O-succinyltransferase [Muribaculaceae bacterium]|nr:homoserine O-succinyltransferase [Muribaculaceae bacterium]
MPVKVPDNLPAIEQLREENIFILNESRADTQDIRPLKVGILNLMPIKSMTETDLLRLISNSPLLVEIDLIETSSYRGTHTPVSHMDTFYQPWNKVKEKYYDGFIITGAPVEEIDFEQVGYWKELCEIMDWTRSHVTSTLYICWGALAGLYHHYGVRKNILPKKISGVFPHRVIDQKVALFRGFDDEFLVPHSRNSEINRTDLEKVEELKIMSESQVAGVHCVMNANGSEIFITGHSEYSPGTLDFEYLRDTEKGLNPSVPENYYRDDNPEKEVLVRWRGHANLLFSNWLNYYVYQQTPYHLPN